MEIKGTPDPMASRAHRGAFGGLTRWAGPRRQTAPDDAEHRAAQSGTGLTTGRDRRAAPFVIRRSPSGECVSHGSKLGGPPDGEIAAVAQRFARRNRVIAR